MDIKLDIKKASTMGSVFASKFTLQLQFGLCILEKVPTCLKIGFVDNDNNVSLTDLTVCGILFTVTNFAHTVTFEENLQNHQNN